MSLKDGSTTGDSELTDIRVSYDGKTYETAGEAVRGQVKDINDTIDIIKDGIWNALENGCDNKGSINCTDIFQEALDSKEYTQFYFPTGTYKLDAYVVLRNLSSIKIYGDGIDKTTFICKNDGFRFFGGSNIELGDFSIQGSEDTKTAGIRFRDDTPSSLNCRVSFTTIRNIHIKYFGAGIDFNAPSGYNYFEKVKVSLNLDGSVGFNIGNVFNNTGDIIPNYIYLNKCQVDGQSNTNAECGINISCGQMIYINQCDICNIVNGYGIKILNNNENYDKIEHIQILDNSIYNIKNGILVQSRTTKYISGIDFSHNMVVCSNVDKACAIALLKKEDANPITRVNIVSNTITAFKTDFWKINKDGISDYSSYVAGNFN